MIVTYPPNHAKVRHAQRQTEVPALVFSDVAELEPPVIYRIDGSHNGSCSYRQRRSHATACADHWHGNNRGDAKVLVALLAVRAACAGRFKWLLLGDDDTFWCHEMLWPVLHRLDHSQPYFLTPQQDVSRIPEFQPLERCPAGSLQCRTRFSGRPNPLDECPDLGPTHKIRLGPHSLGPDPTLMRRDCLQQFVDERRSPLAADSLRLAWYNGGSGAVVSTGLLELVPISLLQKCVDRIVHGGLDLRVASCFGLHGFAVVPLPLASRVDAVKDSRGHGKQASFSTHRFGSACDPKRRMEHAASRRNDSSRFSYSPRYRSHA